MLRKGLTSELFFLAFLQPETGYRLAQMLQGSKKTPNTSKTSTALKKLEKAGYLRRKEDGKFYHVPEKLAQELFDYLENEQGVILDEKEKKILRNLISENYYFIFAAHEVIHKMIDRPKGTHDLDAIKTISDKIGQIFAVHLKLKKKYSSSNKPKNNQSFEKIQEDLSKFVKDSNMKMEAIIRNKRFTRIEKKLGKKYTYNEKMKSINLLNNTMKSSIMIGVLFEKIPDTTLEKFAYLWDQYYGFQIGINLSNVNPMKLNLRETPDCMLN